MNTDKWENEMAKLVYSAVDGQQIRINIGDTGLLVEVASTPGSRSKGLGGRDEIPAEGMLFMYPMDNTGQYHRASMQFPITIRFFNSDGELVYTNPESSDSLEEESQEEESQEEESQEIVDCPVPYRYVVETTQDRQLEGRLVVHGF